MRSLFRFLFLLAGVCGTCALLLSCDDSAENGEPSYPKTWTDKTTGLIWQADLPDTYATWRQAMEYCDALNLAGFDDWRLPNISELRTLLAGCPSTSTGGACVVSTDCVENDCQTNDCYACAYGDGPMDGCYAKANALDAPCEHYWSSSTVPDVPDRAWAIGFAGGFIYKPRVYYSFHARCVR